MLDTGYWIDFGVALLGFTREDMGVTPSLRQKSALYRELGQLLRSGKPFPASVGLLQSATHGTVRNLLSLLKASVDKGAPVGEAFAAQYPQVTHLEASIIGASARSGKLDQGCFFLSDYFSGLNEAQKAVIRKLLYPVFVLHFAAFLNGLPKLVLGGDGMAYLKETFGTLIFIYLCCACLWMTASLVLFEGAHSPAVDRFLRWIPVYGKMRRSFALGRFCTTYGMQLLSGVNVMDSLASAGKTSQSALVNQAVKKALPQIRTGAQVGPLLAGSDAFTQEMVRTILVGEETGELDNELQRMAEDFRIEAMAQLNLLGALFAKGIYLMVVVYAGYSIVKGYGNYLNTVMSIGE